LHYFIPIRYPWSDAPRGLGKDLVRDWSSLTPLFSPSFPEKGIASFEETK
jgi:hypothetical protein